MESAFEGDKTETQTMLPVIEVFMAAHSLPDVTVRLQLRPDSSRSRNIEANPAASSFNGGQGVLPVLAVEGAFDSHATGDLMLRVRDDPHATARHRPRQAFGADDVYGAGDGADRDAVLLGHRLGRGQRGAGWVLSGLDLGPDDGGQLAIDALAETLESSGKRRRAH